MVFGTENNETFYAHVGDFGLPEHRFETVSHVMYFKVSPVQYAELRHIMFDVKPLSADDPNDVDDADTFQRFADYVKANKLTVDDSRDINRSDFADQLVSIFCSAGYFFETLPIASVLRASFVDLTI